MLAASLLMTTHTFVPANSAGRTNKSVANTVLSGKGIPTTKIGINGDFYIDLNTFNIFGPKANNRWPTPVSLRGPAGADGKQGERGSSGSSSSGNKGEQGDKGEKGEKGEKGDKGDKGEKGDTGATGLKGDKGDNGLVGATGVQGLKGDKGDKGDTGATGSIGLTGPTGLQGATGLTGAAGAKGDTGAKGDKGDTGLQGLQGLKGDTGTTGAAGAKGDKGDPGTNGTNGAKGDKGETGAAGPVNVQTVSIPNFSLQTAAMGGSSQSPNFGTLQAGSSYKFELIARGKASSTSSMTRIGLSLFSGGVGDLISYNYVTSNVEDFQEPSVWRGNQFLVIGVIKVGSATSSLSIKVFDGNGSTSSNALNFSGIAIFTLVDTITGLA